jgi:hypothetical protein
MRTVGNRALTFYRGTSTENLALGPIGRHRVGMTWLDEDPTSPIPLRLFAPEVYGSEDDPIAFLRYEPELGIFAWFVFDRSGSSAGTVEVTSIAQVTSFVDAARADEIVDRTTHYAQDAAQEAARRGSHGRRLRDAVARLGLDRRGGEPPPF